MPRIDVSWLLGDAPPCQGELDGPRRLWWAVVRQASYDLRWCHRQLALDALEFLGGTGVWLLESLFAITSEETQEEVVELTLRRNRSVTLRQRI